MATLLTTSRMDPELALRIEASVRGDKKGGARGVSPRLVALARVAVVLAIGGAVWGMIRAKRHEQAELEGARQSILAVVTPRASALTPDDRAALVVMDSWLARGSARYDGDFVDEGMRAPGALAAVMAKQSVYVRGALGSFVNPARINEAAAASSKDALLLCLTEPPASKQEKVLLGPVRTAYQNAGVVEQHTPNARRLNDARVGLPIMMPDWSARVRAADTAPELSRLKRELDHTPLDRASAALRAGILIYAMDEPSDGGGPTELDGERAHTVRLGIVDLTTSKLLLRMRKPVDPSFISPARKAEYATGLDSCALVVDVIESLAHK